MVGQTLFSDNFGRHRGFWSRQAVTESVQTEWPVELVSHDVSRVPGTSHGQKRQKCAVETPFGI